ncbi:MAG: EamA family transporter [Cycloclasticus sp.]|nr:EamA family transporter [Cycloclasticus sp.]MBG97240.1 EamA family transporter [Cycloclasticus sp.]HAI97303.1 EamA/RhaT family transporter [Methylococcaceae bacterium]
MKKLLSSAWVLLILVVIIWGSNWPIMKIGLKSIDPLWFTVARLGIALVAISILLLFLGRLKRPHQQDVPIVVGIGVMQSALFVTLINVGLTEVNAGRAALLAYTTPLWVTPGAYFFLKEPMSRMKMLGAALGVCGLLVLFNPFSFDWNDASVVKGNAILLIAAMIWALSILHIRKHQWKGSVLELTPWQILLALLIIVPYAWFSNTRPVIWSTELVLILLYNGVMATALAQWASMRVTQILPAMTVSLGFLMVPLMGLLSSTLWLKESFTATLGVGATLIIGGLVLQTNLRKPSVN